MLKYIVVIAPLIFAGAQALACDYTLHPHETLSQVAQREYPNSRVYGKHGSLAKLLKFNKEIVNPNIVVVGQVLHLLDMSVAGGGTSCKVFAKVNKFSHIQKKLEITNENHNMPVYHKVRLYRHKIASFNLNGRVPTRSPASLEISNYRVPDTVAYATPEIIFQRGFVFHQIKFKLPHD